MKPLHLETHKRVSTCFPGVFLHGVRDFAPRFIGGGTDRASERLAKHRQRWADTPAHVPSERDQRKLRERMSDQERGPTETGI